MCFNMKNQEKKSIGNLFIFPPWVFLILFIAFYLPSEIFTAYCNHQKDIHKDDYYMTRQISQNIRMVLTVVQ